jgi:predicted RNase H-like HicB family nuclease
MKNAKNVDRSTDASIDSIADKLQLKTKVQAELNDLAKQITPTLVVTTKDLGPKGRLKVRNEKGADTRMRLTKGTTVQFLGEIKTSFDSSGNETGEASKNREHYWMKVQFTKNGQTQEGWVSGEYLSGSLNPDPKPVDPEEDETVETEDAARTRIRGILDGVNGIESIFKVPDLFISDMFEKLAKEGISIADKNGVIRETPYSMEELEDVMFGKNYKIKDFKLQQDGDEWKINWFSLQEIAEVVVTTETREKARERIRGILDGVTDLKDLEEHKNILKLDTIFDFMKDGILITDKEGQTKKYSKEESLDVVNGKHYKIKDFKLEKDGDEWEINWFSLQEIAEVVVTTETREKAKKRIFNSLSDGNGFLKSFESLSKDLFDLKNLQNLVGPIY